MALADQRGAEGVPGALEGYHQSCFQGRPCGLRPHLIDAIFSNYLFGNIFVASILVLAYLHIFGTEAVQVLSPWIVYGKNVWRTMAYLMIYFKRCDTHSNLMPSS